MSEPSRVPNVVHTAPAWRRVGGLNVPCDGPHSLGLGPDRQPVCGDCGTPVQNLGLVR
jgi:hypothetical protein